MSKSNGKNGSTPSNIWAGSGRRGDGKIRVAIVGVGNCASSLVQGRYYYEDAKASDFVPGLMHVDLGGYHIRDIDFVAAFDIDKNKVGKDLSEAIYTKPNNTYVFQQVKPLGVNVDRGMVHDGLGKYLSQIIEKAPGETADIVGILKEREVDVMVSYLPVGSEEATKWYAEQALAAGVAFVNAIPVFIGREPYWQRRFAEAGLPVIGDDIKSQVGATISHRVLTRLFMDRGVRLDRTYQLNFGGNTDFLNMLERERLESKKISKTNAVTSMLDYELDDDDIHVGPSDHVPWLKDRKWCYIRMEGTTYRRRAAQRGDEARGVGQPEQRRRHHRRHPLPEAGPGPWPVRHARCPIQLLHEEPAPADPRRHRVQPGGSVHPRRGQRDAGRHGSPEEADLPQARGLQGQGGRRRAVTGGERRLEAPHRRGGASPRIVERSVVLAYRATAWVLRTVPARPAGALIGLGAQASYLLWPTKRAWSNRNFGHVLGLPPDHPRVRRLALRAYRAYGDYLVELMRVPFMPTDEVIDLIEPLDPAEVALMRASAPDGGIILHGRTCRQQRRDRRGHRPPGSAAQRGRRRFGVSGAVRPPATPA